ncbi:MAG: Crp/Fnr family transcriptional regulator [Alicyclobacillus sp.]|nr:Crp/Fnr family transcriptional regulator [Alicyclobacillus sp.]
MFHVFRKLPVFAEVPDSALRTLCEFSCERYVRKHGLVLEQESTRPTVLFVAAGHLKLVRIDEEGREYIQRIVRDGYLLPGTSLFSHRPLPVYVYALTEATVIETCQRDFEQWLLGYPTALAGLVNEFNRRIDDMYERSHHLAVSPATQRVRYFLEQLVEQYGSAEADGVHIQLPVTQTEIAQLLGVRRESVNRIWNQLRRRRVLQLQNQSWVLSHDWMAQIS